MPIASRFRAIVLTALVIASALAFYMVSLRVSAERSAVERLQARNAALLSDIMQLRSELGTRARLPQLERWNANVLALSAPKPVQYLNSAVQLASYAAEPEAPMTAAVRQAVVIDSRVNPVTPDSPLRTVSAPADEAPRPARVVTAAYRPQPVPARSVEAVDAYKPAEPAAAPRQPVLLHTASYEAPAAAAKQAGRLLSGSVLQEIRAAAAKEAAAAIGAGAGQ